MIHVEDDAAHFSAARFVESLITDSVCNKILAFWVSIYTGLPNKLVFNDELQLKDIFTKICDINDFEWQRSGTQHHSTLGVGERC